MFMKSSRLEAFSDGVFAVAITLLVFDLKVPVIASAHLGRALGHEWPSYLAFTISFLSIGICWVNHHSIFDLVEKVDRALLFTNLGLLLGIVSIPFTTSLVATWYHQGSNAKWAIGVYCANWVFVSLFFMLNVYYLKTREHLSSHSAVITLGSLLQKGYIGLSAYTLATVIALIYPVVSFLICLFLAIYYVFGVRQEELVQN